MARIFVVEDNENLREVVSSYLKLNEHEVVEFERTRGVREAVSTRPPDLIVLDVMLPDGDGFLLAREIRKKHRVPILFLTAKTTESDRITGFEVGGDDYVTKPFSPKELSLRVEAILKRAAEAGSDHRTPRSWTYGENRMDISAQAHRITVNGREVSLTAAEWKILGYLADHNGIVVDRSRLMGESLDYLVAEGSERTVDTHVKNIRSKLGDPEWIETVRGFGYRFRGQETKP
jgi:two-component system phosphate regulon response regulator PhoB